jgi:hypothetical protein
MRRVSEHPLDGAGSQAFGKTVWLRWTSDDRPAVKVDLYARDLARPEKLGADVHLSAGRDFREFPELAQPKVGASDSAVCNGHAQRSSQSVVTVASPRMVS